MTKEEATHLSELFKAYSEGKKIQKLTPIYYNSLGRWVDVDYLSLSDIHNPSEYRVKPEAKIRPYKNGGEFLNAQKNMVCI